MDFLESIEGNEGDVVHAAVGFQVAVLAGKQDIGVLGSRDVRNTITAEDKDSVGRSSLASSLESYKQSKS